MSLWSRPSQLDVRTFACFGSSGSCAQIAFDAASGPGGSSPLVAYVDDYASSGVSPYDGLPVLSLKQFTTDPRFAEVAVLVPISDPAGRRSVIERLDTLSIPVVGLTGSPNLVHPSAHLGRGSVVLSTTRIGPGVRMGDSVLALTNLVGHDSVVGDFVTLAIHSTVLGHVEIGNNVFVGAGALIINGTHDRPRLIGDGAVIGAGAVVDRDVDPGEVVVGPRAMNVREWARTRLSARPGRG